MSITLNQQFELSHATALRKRVSMAMQATAALVRAEAVVQPDKSGNVPIIQGCRQQLAATIISAGMNSHIESFTRLVAADSACQSLASFPTDETPDVSKITDVEIMRVVAAGWNSLAGVPTWAEAK
jgi:hypothetical protein